MMNIWVNQVIGLENEISVTIFQNHDLNRIRYTLKNLTGPNTLSGEPLSGLYLVYLKAVALNMSIILFAGRKRDH
jgi:hypothetical protein